MMSLCSNSHGMAVQLDPGVGKTPRKRGKGERGGGVSVRVLMLWGPAHCCRAIDLEHDGMQGAAPCRLSPGRLGMLIWIVARPAGERLCYFNCAPVQLEARLL